MKLEHLTRGECEALRALGGTHGECEVTDPTARRLVELGIAYRLGGAGLDLTALGEQLYEELVAPEDEPFRSGGCPIVARVSQGR